MDPRGDAIRRILAGQVRKLRNSRNGRKNDPVGSVFRLVKRMLKGIVAVGCAG